MDTIVALSTPAGKGGIAVIRLSGNPLPIARAVFETKAINGEIKPNFMYFGKINAKDFSDLGYMVYFKAPKSYTGEDVVEFHVHGGTRIAEGVISACVSKGARLAERGEFTRRAFLNGKMDLSDAEGVIDMINADSADAVKAAYRLMTGKLSKAVKDVQNELKTVLTGLVAVLDYPEELEDETLPSEEEELEKIVKTLTALQNSRAYGKMIKEGMDIALVGDTNVGKSSLMNAILGYDRAIVSSIKGTTRDFISDSFELSGKKINLCDTAGIRESNDEIEKEGINRSISIVKDARLVLRVLDATQGKPENRALENALLGKKVVEVYNKSDLINNAKNEENKIFVSAKTGDGIDELLKIVAKYFDEEKTSESEVLTSERQLSSVTTAKEKVEEGLNALKAGVTTDCVISVLTEGYTALGEITGETVSEKIIDDIFDKFCVGK